MTKKYKNLHRLLNHHRLILASGSPRRVFLLGQAGIDFRQIIPDIDETNNFILKPYELAVYLAQQKAAKVISSAQKNEIILGCDTIVVLNDRILGKPKSKKEAVEMLSSLSGEKHTVCSAVAFMKHSQRKLSGYELTDVYFKNVSKKNIVEYVETGEPMDKAGAYGIQDKGVFLVDRVDGNIDNVIGLPMTLLDALAGELMEKKVLMKYNYETIGKQLKEKRLSLNKEIKDIVDEIKISEEYLSAIEEGRIQDVPSIIYYGLFVRSYAGELGIDPEQMLEDACTDEPFAESKNAATDKSPLKAGHETAPTNYTSPGKLIGWFSAIVILAFITVLAVSQFTDRSSESDEPGKSEVIDSANMEETEIVDNDSTEMAMIAESTAQIDSPTTDQSPPLPVEPELPPMRLDIAISEISWMLILADNDTVLHRNLEKDATRSLRAYESFNISIGNPNGVQMHLNDTLVRPLSRTGRPVTNLLITQKNKEEFFLLETENSPGEDSLAEGN